MMGNFVNFCQRNNFSRQATDNIYHLVEEILLVTGYKTGTEVILTYSEKTMDIQLTFENISDLDKQVLDRKENALSAAIIRNSCESIEIEGNRIQTFASRES